ncbi:MAG: hypothetical protein ACI311_03475 [Bacilli bacterium]
MKYKRILIIPIILLAVSCKVKNPDPVDNGDQEKINNEIALIESSKNSTGVIENFVVTQNAVKYREIYESKQFDSINNREHIYYQEKGISSLEETSPTYEKSSDIYYDGTYSYRYEEDLVYHRSKDEKVLNYYELPFDVSVMSNITISQQNFKTFLNGEISGESIEAFLGYELNTDVIYCTTTTNGSNLTSLKITYTQNDFNVVREFTYAYLEAEIQLPSYI